MIYKQNSQTEDTDNLHIDPLRCSVHGYEIDLINSKFFNVKCNIFDRYGQLVLQVVPEARVHRESARGPSTVSCPSRT